MPSPQSSVPSHTHLIVMHFPFPQWNSLVPHVVSASRTKHINIHRDSCKREPAKPEKAVGIKSVGQNTLAMLVALSNYSCSSFLTC